MEEKLLNIIVNLCDEEEIRENLDMDLIEEGLLDSLAMVELLVSIEDEFGVVISPTEFDKDELSSVHKIEKILVSKGVKA